MRKYVRRIMRAQAEKSNAMNRHREGFNTKVNRPYRSMHRRFKKLQEKRYGKLYDFRQPSKIKGYIGPRYYSLLW